MKIYFAGSIRGGRQDAALYRCLIDLLKQHGDVLTEHVADPILSETALSDEAIYRRDMRWLRQSDTLVAEVTVPSHGVGYEIARAQTLGKPVLCLYRPDCGHRLSALLAGNPAIGCRAYERFEELSPILDAFFNEQAQQRSHSV